MCLIPDKGQSPPGGAAVAPRGSPAAQPLSVAPRRRQAAKKKIRRFNSPPAIRRPPNLSTSCDDPFAPPNLSTCLRTEVSSKRARASLAAARCSRSLLMPRKGGDRQAGAVQTSCPRPGCKAKGASAYIFGTAHRKTCKGKAPDATSFFNVEKKRTSSTMVEEASRAISQLRSRIAIPPELETTSSNAAHYISVDGRDEAEHHLRREEKSGVFVAPVRPSRPRSGNSSPPKAAKKFFLGIRPQRSVAAVWAVRRPPDRM